MRRVVAPAPQVRELCVPPIELARDTATPRQRARDVLWNRIVDVGNVQREVVLLAIDDDDVAVDVAGDHGPQLIAKDYSSLRGTRSDPGASEGPDHGALGSHQARTATISPRRVLMAAATSSHARCDRLDVGGSSSPVVTVPELSPPITTLRDFAAMIVVAEPRTHLLDSRLMFVADFG